MLSARMFGQSYTYQSITFPGAQLTHAWGINNAGTIVGSYSANGSFNEVAWKLTGGTFSTVSMPFSVTFSQADSSIDGV